MKHVVVIGGGHAGIVPTPRFREAERDRREASIPMIRGEKKELR
jgi:NADH dehydrogenase FAD-containing subunit